MKIYLDESLQNIKVFKDLLILMKDLVSSNELTSISKVSQLSDLYKLAHVEDPVRDFIEFYLADSRQNWDYERIQYVSNALYAAKGSVNLFSVISETFEIEISYRLNFPVITILSFSELKVSNLELFITKFRYMLDYLLYYADLNIYVKNLLLVINDNLTEYSSILSTGYRYHIATL